jgi:hypothetical protein
MANVFSGRQVTVSESDQCALAPGFEDDRDGARTGWDHLRALPAQSEHDPLRRFDDEEGAASVVIPIVHCKDATRLSIEGGVPAHPTSHLDGIDEELEDGLR